MKRVLLLAVVAAVAASAQWLETTIEVGHPPAAVCYNTLDDKLYCVTSAGSLGMLVIDGVTSTVSDTVPHTRPGYSLCYNPVENEVYWSTLNTHARPDGVILVVDGSANAVLDTMGAVLGVYISMRLNSTSNKLYADVEGMTWGVKIYDCTTRELLGTEPGIVLVHNPADNKLYVNNWSLRIIDGVGDSLLDSLPSVRDGQSACHNPLQGKVYVGRADSVFAVDGAGDSLLGAIPLPGLSMCYDPIDDKLYCADGGTSVSVVDCTADTVLTAVDAGRPVSGLLYEAAYNNVYCISRDSNDVTVIDCSEDTVLVTIDVGQAPSAHCCNPQYERVYVANADDSTISVICTSPVGVEEEAVGRPAQQPGLYARGVLELTGHTQGELLDIAGRKVADLVPGPNDIRQVAPGVYFVREEEGDRTHKVIIQR